MRQIRIPGALLSVLLMFAGELIADPLAWQLHRDDTRITVLGSVHAGHSDFYPLAPVIEQAFESAGSLWVELDITRLDPRRYQALVQQQGLHRADEAADFHRSPVWQQFQQLCALERFCQPAHKGMRPWLLSLQLAQQLVAESRYRPALGVDVYFLGQRGDRAVYELESLEQQIQAFAGLDASAQQALLLSSVQDYQRGPEALESLFNAWLAGDASTMSELILSPMRANEAVYQALLADRNQLMAHKLDSASLAGGVHFVVVGAGHLLGESSLIRLLVARGFTAVQISGDVCVEPAC